MNFGLPKVPLQELQCDWMQIMPDNLPSISLLFENVGRWHANIIMIVCGIPSENISISSAPLLLTNMVNIRFLDLKDC